MPRRTAIFQQFPWNGGLNSSVDSGVLPSNDLIQADHVTFATNGARLKREGFSYFDTAPLQPTHRSSSGTTRKLIFASAVTTGSVDHYHVGERLIVAGASNSNYNSLEAVVSAISTTNTANDTVEYSFAGAASLTESTTASTPIVTRGYSIIGTHDYWYFDSGNGIKQQELVAVSNYGEIYAYNTAGNRKHVPKNAGATANAVVPVERCDMLTFNNKCVVTLEGVGNKPRFYDAMSTTEWFDLPGAPDGEFMREHLGRIFMNDKADKDFLHFCETFDETQWQGIGDSGAIYIGIEDGDPRGITGIAPPFKGLLLVSKGEKIVKIAGDAPENFVVEPMTSGLGGVNHKAWVAVDFDDVFFMSRRGFHSAVATNNTGDFESNFLSKKIQPTFNTWNKERLTLTQGVYIESLNSICWSVVEDGETQPSALYFYNPTINEGEWYRWPGVTSTSVGKRLDLSESKLIFGTADGRIQQAQNGQFSDNDASYTYRIKTGTLYVDQNPQTIKGFKRVSLLFRQRGRFSFNMLFKVDNQPAQSFVFNQSFDGDELGINFVLGQSVLGSETYMAPVTRQVIGYGRGCSIELSQTGPQAQVEIYGFMVEYESADLADEVKD